MRRLTTVLAAGTLTALLSACGTNNITDSFRTPAVTAPVQTATATKVSIATATAIPPTATATAVPPTATVASVPLVAWMDAAMPLAPRPH